jgi:hypothetical protein
MCGSGLERVDARRLTPHGKRIYARRKETVERSFADAKQLHGASLCAHARIEVAEQCLLVAAAQNMKKIALLLPDAPSGRTRMKPTDVSLHTLPRVW